MPYDEVSSVALSTFRSMFNILRQRELNDILIDNDISEIHIFFHKQLRS